MDATKEEILNRLKEVNIIHYKDLLEVLKLPKRTVEKWFLPNGNFPSWFIHYLELLEENNLLEAKIKVLELELKKGETEQ